MQPFFLLPGSESSVWVPFYTETQIRIFNQNRTFRFFTKIRKKKLIIDPNDPQRRWILWILFSLCTTAPHLKKKSIFFEVRRGGCTKDRSFSTPDTYGPEKSKRYKLEHISCLSSCTAHLYGHF